jgi:farnesyl diphosphate synthase
MGASSGSALTPEIAEQLRAYARAIGLAFQVVDDVLDASENTDTLGKTAGKDALEGKPTFVSLMGIDAAREYSQQLLQEALDAIATLDDSADQLRSLATLIVSRDH